jgi:opacity protein-like surface antigen
MLLAGLVAGAIASFAVAPTTARAQNGNDNDETIRNLFSALFGPNWNVFAHGGASTNGRFLLQGPVAPSGGQRALRADNSFNVGAGAGVDLLPRVGVRLSYTYTDSDLSYRTDDGDGSEVLDVDDTGALRSHIAAIEIIRYMFPARNTVTPYASAGVLGTWWVLDEESLLVTAAGGSTQFRFGALASFGVQFNIGGGVHGRLEVASQSVRNPFTGDQSFLAAGATTIDEPGRVTKTDFRLVLVHRFGTP